VEFIMVATIREKIHFDLNPTSVDGIGTLGEVRTIRAQFAQLRFRRAIEKGVCGFARPRRVSSIAPGITDRQRERCYDRKRLVNHITRTAGYNDTARE